MNKYLLPLTVALVFLVYCFGPSIYWLPHPIISLCPYGGKFQISHLIGFKHIHLLWQSDDQIQSKGVCDCVCFPKQSSYTADGCKSSYRTDVAIGAIRRYHYVTEFGSFKLSTSPSEGDA